MSVRYLMHLGFVLLSGVYGTGGYAASCDGLTATVYIQELPIGRSACDSAKMLVHDLDSTSSIQTRSEIGGCTVVGGVVTAESPEGQEVYVRVQINREFAASSKIDGFDLGKKLWPMREHNPAIKRVEVCRDVSFARP